MQFLGLIVNKMTYAVDFCTKCRIGITFAHYSKSRKTIRLQWNFRRSRISAGFGTSAGFWLEPELDSGTVLLD